MKVAQFPDGEETMEAQIIRLRYGCLQPIKNQTPLYSMSVVAKYLCIEPRVVRNVVERYFYNQS